MLTKAQIRVLIGELGYTTMFEDPGLSGVRLQRKTLGYADDKQMREIQTALSVMLEAAR
jgi:hypothetical protein